MNNYPKTFTTHDGLTVVVRYVTMVSPVVCRHYESGGCWYEYFVRLLNYSTPVEFRFSGDDAEKKAEQSRRMLIYGIEQG